MYTLIIHAVATLEPAISATVNEGGELQVCVSLDPPATGNTVVTVATSVETATGGKSGLLAIAKKYSCMINLLAKKYSLYTTLAIILWCFINF